MAKQLNRREFLALSAAASAAVVGLLVSPRIAFADGTTTPTPGPLPPPPAAGPLTAKAAGGIEKLIEAAKIEAELSPIALPNDWANYGEVKSTFLAKYPFLKLNDLNPDAGSADEIEAVKANAGSKGPQAPDILDIGFIWGPKAKEEGLLQPYQVETWETIPADLKDADGYFYGNYYGTMSFEVNADALKAANAAIPQDWNDLLKPEYKGLIAMNGDPTTGSQPQHAVWAAAYGLTGTLDKPEAGLEFFKKLAESGNLVATLATPASIAKGETPITFRWDYNALANRDNNKDTAAIEVVYPKSGTVAGVYLCAISAYAPRPAAARLWMEFVYSDEGQNLWLKGYAKPVRFEDLSKRKAIPEETLKRLPAADVKVAFPKTGDLNNALTAIKENWPKVVGVTFTK